LATAVLRSLEGEPALRYTTARELANALRDGLSGAEPLPPDSEAATRTMTGTRTQATRRIPLEEPTPPTRRAPAPRPAPRRAAPAAAPAAARSSTASRVRRAIGLLLVIAILAAIIAAIVLVTTNAGQNTGPGELIKNTLQDQINAVKDFITSHTR
jgi:ferric-dicitrate binding protein FerR (iron transport regulator)